MKKDTSGESRERIRRLGGKTARIASVIAAFYYLNVARCMFFLPAEDEGRVKVSLPLAVALGISTAVTLLIGLYPQPFIDFATQSVRLLSIL